MPRGFEEIAFATPEKFHSLFKWKWKSGMTAQGTLAISPGRVLFVGPAGKIDVRDPKQVAVVRVPIPWLTLVLSNFLFLLFVFGGFTKSLTPDNPETFALLIAVDVLYIVVYCRQRWVEIVYAGENGQPERAYFTPASQLGWLPSPKRVDQLCDGFRSALETDAVADAAPESPGAPAPGAAAGQRSLTVVCEDCGRENVFLARHFGTVQHCQHCNAFVDVEQAAE